MILLLQTLGYYDAHQVLAFSQFIALVGGILVVVGLLLMCKLATFNRQLGGFVVGGIGVILLALALILFCIQKDAPNGEFNRALPAQEREQ